MHLCKGCFHLCAYKQPANRLHAPSWAERSSRKPRSFRIGWKQTPLHIWKPLERFFSSKHPHAIFRSAHTHTQWLEEKTPKSCLDDKISGDFVPLYVCLQKDIGSLLKKLKTFSIFWAINLCPFISRKSNFEKMKQPFLFLKKDMECILVSSSCCFNSKYFIYTEESFYPLDKDITHYYQS